MHDEHQQAADQYYSEAFIKSLHGRVGALEEDVRRTTEAMERMEKSISSVVELFGALEGGFRVLQGLGKLARPVGYIGAAIAGCIAAWTAIKGLGK